MSEPKGPFDAAIRRISVLVNDHGDGTDAWTWDIIRPILEAAPKIRETIVEFLEWGPMTGSDMELHRDRFRALLESLPEPEEERK
jgi:hypothetical protein